MSDRTSTGFLDTVFDRTITNLRHVWRDIAASARGVLSSAPRPDLSGEDADRLRVQLRDCLEGRGGGVSARARAAALGRTYLALNEAGRERFLHVLATEFDVDRALIQATWERLRRAKSDDERMRGEWALRRALDAPRIRLLTQFNALPEGVKFLVDMRAELMALAKHDPALAALELDLKDLLAGWFDIGFLEVKRITWDSPASLLEKLTGYEAVHAIRSWKDLKNRLEADRRCFGYFHPRMPDEPLIFVEVALTQGMADNVQLLLDENAPMDDPADADTAIFYSISNCQRGLSGISFGDFLIKRVVDQLAAELPHLKTYATLSPVTGFRPWLEKRLAERGDDVLTASERKAFEPATHPRASRLVQGRERRAGGARAAAAARRALCHSREEPGGARARPGGAFPSQQRRPSGAAQLAQRSLRQGAAAILRNDDQLSLSPRRDRG
jgi:malonyl-CoA decarboxylase